jgi:hypothetical protein
LKELNNREVSKRINLTIVIDRWNCIHPFDDIE